VKKILVTGGAGFIGGSLVTELIRDQFKVIVYDNLSTGDASNLSLWNDNDNCEFICADMLDPSTLLEAAEGCNMVIHLAANPDVRLASKDSQIDFDQNVLATYNLLEVMRKSSLCKRIIFLSSSTVYGEPAIMPTPESYPTTKPISLYGATKLACESLISGYCHMYNMAGLALRLANVVGPNSSHGIIFDFITKLSKTPKNLKILGNGKQNKSYLYIDDCISAIRIAQSLLENKEGDFDVFNVGSTDRITVMEIAKIVIEELFLSDVSITFEGREDGRGWAGDVMEMLLDSAKLQEYGWEINLSSYEAVARSSRRMVRRMQMITDGTRLETDIKIPTEL
jgi:UDP-glucose 4-epimerase